MVLAASVPAIVIAVAAPLIGLLGAALGFYFGSADLEREKAILATEPSPDEKANSWPSLWHEARKWTSKYHTLALYEGRRSFRLLMASSAVGFGILGFVIWQATRVHTVVGGITIGAAGTVSGALAAYISRTFMSAYRRANEKFEQLFQSAT